MLAPCSVVGRLQSTRASLLLRRPGFRNNFARCPPIQGPPQPQKQMLWQAAARDASARTTTPRLLTLLRRRGIISAMARPDTVSSSNRTHGSRTRKSCQVTPLCERVLMCATVRLLVRFCMHARGQMIVAGHAQLAWSQSYRETWSRSIGPRNR